MTTKSKKFDMLYVHIAVMLVLIIGAHFVPTVGPITPVGMKILGVFIAMLYGWSICGMVWPSMLGMLGVAMSGVVTMKEFANMSFGNETIVYMIFVMVFTGVIDEVGLINYIANKMISFKFLNGRPWLFTAFLLIGAFISSAFINMFATILVVWGIIYIVAERFDFKPQDQWPMLMIMGTILASSIGGCIMPYKPVPLVILQAYSTISGTSMDFFKYICFSLPVTFLVMVFYVLICRFVFRPDIKDLKHISVDFADKDALILNKKQKVAVAFLVAFIFLMIAPSILPAEWALTLAIKQLGLVGCVLLLLVLMYWVKVDGETLLDFPKMTKHISWEVILTFAFIIPFAGIFTGDATGIKECIIMLLKPVLVGMSPIVFLAVTLLIATVLTNIANNMVVGAVFATLIFTIGSGIMGMDVTPMIAVLIVCCNLALATPAASPTAAMCFANSKWCKTSDLYKYGWLTVLLGFVFTAIVGLAWASIIY